METSDCYLHPPACSAVVPPGRAVSVLSGPCNATGVFSTTGALLIKFADRLLANS